jgi:HK97 family phage major capsid protein
MRAYPHNPFLRTRNATPADAMLHRSVELNRAAVNEADRTVEIAFSSEASVERYFGTEILGHEKKNVRIGRLNNGGALLVEHEPRDQVGVVVRAWIDDDKKGRALVRFGKSARAEEIFQDVKDGIRRLVSVGYRIHDQEVTKGQGGVETVRATDWEPYELSLVSIPADDSVGVGRGMNPPPTHSNQSTNNQMKDKLFARLRALNIAFEESASTDALRSLLPEAERSQFGDNATSPAAPAPTAQRSLQVVSEPAPQPDPVTTARRAVEDERRRVDSITAIAEQAQRQGIQVDARAAIRDGHTPDQFREAAFTALVGRQQSYTPGMPDQFSRGDRADFERFDLAVALRSLVSGESLTGIEREVLDEGYREAASAGIGRSRGIMLPSFMVRTLSATGGTDGDKGGMTVATNKAGLLDDFFNASIMRQLGATVLTGLTGNLDVPRLIQDTDPAGKAENAGADEVSPETAQLELKPKRLPAFINLSDQLLMQSSSAIEAMIRGHLTAQLLAVQERAFFHGGGTNEANGLAGTTGIGSVAGGTNGAAPTFAHLVELEEKVDAQNAIGGSLAYASNGQIRAKLKLTPKQASGVEGNFLLTDLNPNVLNGYPVQFTNAIRRNLTKGSADAVASAIFFGNFQDYVVGYWGGLNLELIRDSANAKLGMHTLVANTYYDGGVRRPKSFAAMLDALGA